MLSRRGGEGKKKGALRKIGFSQGKEGREKGPIHFMSLQKPSGKMEAKVKKKGGKSSCFNPMRETEKKKENRDCPFSCVLWGGGEKGEGNPKESRGSKSTRSRKAEEKEHQTIDICFLSFGLRNNGGEKGRKL